MASLNEEYATLGNLLRETALAQFQMSYPQLTDEDIAHACRPELCEGCHSAPRWDEDEVRILQSFYRTTSYADSVKELHAQGGMRRFEQRNIRHTVLRAIQHLPKGSPLQIAMEMAYRNLNILRTQNHAPS